MIETFELALETLVDGEHVAIDRVASALCASLPNAADATKLAGLVELGTRLPSGLLHADAIWVLHEPPPGITPLAPGSPWYAMDHSLVVVLTPGRRALAALLKDLATYYLIADRVRIQLGARPELIEVLLSDQPSAALSTELALLLDGSPQLVAALDQRAPGLRHELGGMAQRAFAPPIRVHAALRPRLLRERGERLAEDLLARAPQGPMRLCVSDGTLVLEHLSPYVRDLGFALTAWGLENADLLRTAGLADALRDAGGKPSADLAALVVPDLFEASPELLDERREAEESAGLFQRDGDGTALGWTELSRLAHPDELAIPRDASGTLAVIAGGGEEVLLAATRMLLESGRVTGVSSVLSSGIDAGRAIVPDALATDRDGHKIIGAQELAERAARIGLTIHRAGCVLVDESNGAPLLAVELLGQARRAKVMGRLPEEAPSFVILYGRGRPGGPQALSARISEVEAGRLALLALSSQADSPVGGRSKPGVSQNVAGVSRRFRA